MPTVTVKSKLPDFNRKAFTDLLIEGKEIVPFHNYALLIDHQFFYSHESDVEEALEERFYHEWGTRKYALEVRLQESLLEEENLDKIPDGCDANSFFKHLFKLEMRHVRSAANAEIAHCWVTLLKHRPEYVDRCPWHFFHGRKHPSGVPLKTIFLLMTISFHWFDTVIIAKFMPK